MGSETRGEYIPPEVLETKIEQGHALTYDEFVSLPRSTSKYEGGVTLSRNRNYIVNRLKLAGISLEDSKHLSDQEIQSKIDAALRSQDRSNPKRLRGNLDWRSLGLLRDLCPPEQTETTQV